MAAIHEHWMAAKQSLALHEARLAGGRSRLRCG